VPFLVELMVNGTSDPAARYLTWTPYPAQLRLVDADGAPGPVPVVLRNADDNVGRLAFRADPSEDGEPEAVVELPVDGSPVDFLLSGEFLAPSTDDGDAVLEAVVGDEVVAQVPFMVRVRKDADTLTDRERDRFVSAFAILNNLGFGPFRGFHQMHTQDTNDEAHSLDAFLPWHRAYLLDLERELQLVDPAVALPYWRFDRPAPRLFSPDFVGAPSGAPSQSGGPPPALAPSNPLQSWTIDGTLGIDRHPLFADPRSSPAVFFNGQDVRPVVSEIRLLQFAAENDLDYAYEDLPDDEGELGFRDFIEGNPHGAAHVSFSGSIRSPGTAAGDPLFFLLHCNVDRLWAGWQFLNGRFDGTRQDTYFFRGAAGQPGSALIGHNLLDSMWPWNGDTAPPRPPTAPRMPFPVVPTAAAPGPAPRVRDMIDYAGFLNPAADMNFAYDNVPFGVAP
jgi:tyrosinase